MVRFPLIQITGGQIAYTSKVTRVYISRIKSNINDNDSVTRPPSPFSSNYEYIHKKGR
jgi:hypothetical protein